MRFCLCPRRTPFNQNQEYRFLLRLPGWTVKLVPASQFLTDRPPPRKGSPHIGRICARRNIFPMPLTHRKVLLTGYFPRKKREPRKITISTEAKCRFCILHRFHGTLGGDVPRTQTRSVEEWQCISRDESISASACSKIFSFIWHKYDRYAGAIIQGATVYYAI